MLLETNTEKLIIIADVTSSNKKNEDEILVKT